MNLFTLAGILDVALLAVAAYEGQWCGILAFAIALLLLFELDMHADAERNDDET